MCSTNTCLDALLCVILLLLPWFVDFKCFTPLAQQICEAPARRTRRTSTSARSQRAKTSRCLPPPPAPALARVFYSLPLGTALLDGAHANTVSSAFPLGSVLMDATLGVQPDEPDEEDEEEPYEEEVVPQVVVRP